jgi:flagellar hook-length control protein FliK
LSSVNAVQHADPRPRALNASPARDGDPFSEILDNVAGVRRELQEAPNGTGRTGSPTAAQSCAKSRAESLGRGETPTCADIKDGREEEDHATQVLDGAEEPKDGEGEPVVALTVEGIERSDEAAASSETAKSKGVEPSGEEVVDAELDADATDHCEDDPACATQVIQARPVDEFAVEISPIAETPEPKSEIEPIRAEAEAEVASDVPDEVVEPEPSGNADETPKQAEAMLAATAVPQGATDSGPPAVEEATNVTEAVQTVQPALPENTPKSPPGLEHAPGQQPVHPNPVAAAARENAPPFSGDGNPQKHPDHPQHPQHSLQPQNASHAEEAKSVAPGQIRAAEVAQQPATGPEQPASMQIDSGASVPPYQSARPLSASLDPAILQPASSSNTAPVPLSGNAIALEIVSRMRDGIRRFDIRLDPPELGRIEVRLDLDRHGHVTTRLTVDRPETLELMQREARGLERALQQAGLKTDEGGLQFSLRQQSDSYVQSEHGLTRNAEATGEDAEFAGSAVESYRAMISARGGVDIRV